MTKFRKYDDFINGKYAINAINSNKVPITYHYS